MKYDSFEHYPALAAAPTAQEALRQVADKLRKAGATLPIPVTAEPTTVATAMTNGLSIALCTVEADLETLIAAAPRDNPVHRALFALPPIKESEMTEIAPINMPVQKVITGDAEIDAVLWLREMISTGQPELIARATEAAARIKTPLEDIARRYTQYVVRKNPTSFGAALSSVGFGDLDGLANAVVRKGALQREAHARLGDAVFDFTPAEQFCRDALTDLVVDEEWAQFDDLQVDQRFDARQAQRPGTLADCLRELSYWDALYWLRDAAGGSGDPIEEANARQDYIIRCLGRIPPRDASEAASVFQHMVRSDAIDRPEFNSIVLNLIGAAGQATEGGSHA